MSHVVTQLSLKRGIIINKELDVFHLPCIFLCPLLSQTPPPTPYLNHHLHVRTSGIFSWELGHQLAVVPVGLELPKDVESSAVHSLGF